MNYPFSYRPEIDGLRAVAILFVVIFHAFPHALPNGYVGVDVFFVLSGYLITNVILRNIEQGRFDFLEFYAHRFRRLMPAMATVLITVFVVGFFVLRVSEFHDLGRQILAGATYTSNFLLFRHTGYFDSVAEEKPLLHLWSLSVEEQFYIVWPALLVWSRRSGFSTRRLILAIGTLSLAFNLVFVGSHPDANFYLLPGRLWELLLGAFLAAYLVDSPSRGPSARNAKIISILSLIFLIVIPLLPKFQTYPGWRALLPTSFTFLLLLTLPSSPSLTKILSQPIFVWLGKISYPLYLWHWPLLSGAMILGQGEVSLSRKFSVLALSLGLSWLTWKYIETPVKMNLFRGQERRRRNRSFLFVGVSVSLLFCLLATLTILNHGFPKTKSEVVQKTVPLDDLQKSCFLTQELGQKIDWCYRENGGAVDTVVFGDSHAWNLFVGLHGVPHSQKLMIFAHHGCPPIPPTKAENADDLCIQLRQAAFFSALKEPSIKTVILVATARNILAKANGYLDTKLMFQSGFEEASKTLLAAGKQVIFISDNPGVSQTPELCLPRPLSFAKDNHRCVITRASWTNDSRPYQDLVHHLHKTVPTVKIYDPTDLLCDQNQCAVMRDDQSLYSYTDHLSDYGAMIVAKNFYRWLDTNLSR